MAIDRYKITTTGVAKRDNGLWCRYDDVAKIVQEAYQNGKRHADWEWQQRKSARVDGPLDSVREG